MPIAFYCRARPQRCDAFDIFKSARRVFIGYPLVRRGHTYDSQALRTCLVDPRCPDEQWKEQILGRENRNFSRNRNFIPDVTDGSIVVVPRPSRGSVYLGRVTGEFEIVDAPSWGQDYLHLRLEKGLDANDDSNHHIADVVQGWPVDGFSALDFSRVPGWLRRSLLGRSTYNRLPSHPVDGEVTAYSVLDGILRGADAVRMVWSLEPEVVKKRLVDTLNNPSAFENLIVALLQLEYPKEIWDHTGGPGDGGIDGLGSNEAGEVVGLMQAKYYADHAPGLGNLATGDRTLRRYAAVFLPENPRAPTDGTRLLNLDWTVAAVCRHWRRLPLALTLRIGERRD